MNRHAEIELLMLPADPDAGKHYAALAIAIDGEKGRTCEQCRKQYARTRGESKRHWQSRKFCGRTCAGLAARIKQAADKRAERIEDLEWLVGTDTPENISRRLGYSDLDTLIRSLQRWDRPDLLAKLNRNAERVAA